MEISHWKVLWACGELLVDERKSIISLNPSSDIDWSLTWWTDSSHDCIPGNPRVRGTRRGIGWYVYVLKKRTGTFSTVAQYCQVNHPLALSWDVPNTPPQLPAQKIPSRPAAGQQYLANIEFRHLRTRQQRRRRGLLQEAYFFHAGRPSYFFRSSPSPPPYYPLILRQSFIPQTWGGDKCWLVFVSSYAYYVTVRRRHVTSVVAVWCLKTTYNMSWCPTPSKNNTMYEQGFQRTEFRTGREELDRLPYHLLTLAVRKRTNRCNHQIPHFRFWTQIFFILIFSSSPLPVDMS